MATDILRISTLLLAGVVIGVTLGAAVCSNLPAWLAVATIAGVGFLAIEAYYHV